MVLLSNQACCVPSIYHQTAMPDRQMDIYFILQHADLFDKPQPFF
ncbi:hypothetical protein ANACOL_04319 [Anaerotruncus colihominis DSM 17241]|uniref:Uncharacterized protein n=1 Tax=Anaerotruncus colihominis DSM 17241 TaxID=445972 RepID=B0PHM5_9FIRM|nr:hypothetical protein ANACOL_04319 [Anaerotruncus colihominis DSM 17241]